jgi:hypothetical protein
MSSSARRPRRNVCTGHHVPGRRGRRPLRRETKGLLMSVGATPVYGHPYGSFVADGCRTLRSPAPPAQRPYRAPRSGRTRRCAPTDRNGLLRRARCPHRAVSRPPRGVIPNQCAHWCGNPFPPSLHVCELFRICNFSLPTLKKVLHSLFLCGILSIV